MKYIVVKNFAGTESIYLFSSTLNHVNMALKICGPQYAAGEVVSAGSIMYDEDAGVCTCIGESLTLKVKSRGEPDNILLRASLRTMY